MKPAISLLLLVSLFLCQKADAQSEASSTLEGAELEAKLHTAIQQKTNEIYDSLVSLRRDLHTYPELAGQERQTSEKIAAYLTSLGLEVKTHIGGFGVVGILKGGKPGRKVAWRADIDALASDIPEVVDFPSQNEGVRHLCGHDVHTAVALGIANVLASMKEQLGGTVYFIFQPSEENLMGAEAMMDDGLLDLIHPEEIYALHISPFPTGSIATKPEMLFAGTKRIKVTLKKSDHTEEALDFTKDQLSSLHSVPPESEFWDPLNLGDPEIGIAGLNSIYRDYLLVNKNFKVEESGDEISLSTFISSSDSDQEEKVLPFLETQFRNSPLADELMRLEYLPETPTILNEEELASKTMQRLTSIYGKERVIALTGVIADGRSDDFALFQEKVPGVYFFLGGSDYEANVISYPHAANFKVDEESIRTGVTFFSSMLLERTRTK